MAHIPRSVGFGHPGLEHARVGFMRLLGVGSVLEGDGWASAQGHRQGIDDPTREPIALDPLLSTHVVVEHPPPQRVIISEGIERVPVSGCDLHDAPLHCVLTAHATPSLIWSRPTCRQDRLRQASHRIVPNRGLCRTQAAFCGLPRVDLSGTKGT